MTQIAVRTPAAVRLTFSGQSMLFLPPAPYDVAYMVASALNLESEYANIGHSGEGWHDLYTNRLSELTGAARNQPGCADVLVLPGGQGDILNVAPSGNQTAATCYTRTVTYADAGRAAGFDYVVGCTLPAWGDGFYDITAEQTATKDALNTLLVADAEDAFDAVALAHEALSDATDTDLYLFDELHLTLEGGRRLSQALLTALYSLPLFA